MFAGHVPNLDRAAAICDALGLEFYIGPKRRTLDRLDVDAAALTLADMRNAIVLLVAGRAEGADVVDTFLCVYLLQVDLIDSVAVTGSTREEAAALVRRRRTLLREAETLRAELLQPRGPLEPDEARAAEETAEFVVEALRASSDEPVAEEPPAREEPPEEPQARAAWAGRCPRGRLAGRWGARSAGSRRSSRRSGCGGTQEQYAPPAGRVISWHSDGTVMSMAEERPWGGGHPLMTCNRHSRVA